jgi:hypothetical protein
MEEEEEEEFAKDIKKEKEIKFQNNLKFEEQLRNKLIEQQKEEQKNFDASKSIFNDEILPSSNLEPIIIIEDSQDSNSNFNSNYSQDSNIQIIKLKELTEKAELMSLKLQQTLKENLINVEELNEILRNFGQIAKGVYEITGQFLNHNQLQNITQSTQSILKIGQSFKTNGLESDSPTVRENLLNSTSILLGIIKDVGEEYHLNTFSNL